jgi:hypothetical protein
MITRGRGAHTCILLLFLLFGCLSEPEPHEPVALDVHPVIYQYPLGGLTGSAGEAMYVIPGEISTVKSRLREIVVDKQAPGTAFSPDEGLNIVVFRGVFSTGGHGISIDKVLLDGSTFLVHATYSDPGPGMMVTQAITQPTAIIPLGKLKKGGYQVRLLVTRKVVTREGTKSVGEEREHGRVSFTVGT